MNRIFARKWIQLSAIWVIIALVPVGRVFLFDPFFIQASFYIVILCCGLLLIPLLIYWISYLQRKKLGWITIFFILFFFSILLSFLFYYVTGESYTGMKMRVNPGQLQAMPPVKRISFYLFSGSSYTVFTSLVMLSGLALLIEYNEQLRERKNSETELRLRLLMSQVKALQSELQPHFLFNTLHAASSLMETDTGKAQQLIEKLSFLLRSYLEIINRQFYSFAEEIEFLKEYIEVQELRHNGKIVLDLQVPQDCMQYQVPVILLQPIIENSVKHAWTDRNRPLHIMIHVEITGDSFCITVRDDGVVPVVSERTGIGIRNLTERLNVLYNGKYSFVQETAQGYSSMITIPLQK
ncbi:MAG: histidine kinase [Bacteroidota bacterium]